DIKGGAPLLNIFGGKITTYRRLAESAFGNIAQFFPNAGQQWTAGTPLPGGDFSVDGVDGLIANAQTDYGFLDAAWAKRLVRCYGTELWDILGNAKHKHDLGIDFGAGLSELEVAWLMTNEFAQQAEDIIWRRTKLGLRMSDKQVKQLEEWIANRNKATENMNETVA
ncbi:MAG: glycerol-3-phosphate dehydrogenase, partial [Rhizobiales bacterium]|nr:glycerol-3-phosphate dehydrogenase [Hyphomicrobiales bacterium]